MDSRELFINTPPVRLFFTAALPGAVSMVASSLYTMIDGILVGQVLGDTPFAALNLAFPFVIINFALADLIGVGSAVPISIALGAKREREANNIFTCACILILLAGILSGAVLYFAAPWLIGIVGAEGELLSLAVQYLRVYALCSPLTTIVFAMDNYMRICGLIRGSMLLNILMSALSVAIELTFLVVLDLGIWAAALATCLGMMICALIALSVFVRGRRQLKFVRPRFSWATLRTIAACGSPSFLNNIAGRVTSILMNTLLLRFGGQDAVNVYGVLMYTEDLARPLMYGMCDSLQPAVGYNWGAGSYGRVRSIEGCCFTACAAVSLVFSCSLLLFPEQIASLFLGEGSSELMDMARTAMRLFALAYLTRWLSMAAQNCMAAVGYAGRATAISLGVMLVFPLLFIALFWPLGLTGLWLNFAGTSLMAGALSAVLMAAFLRELKRRGERVS